LVNTKEIEKTTVSHRYQTVVPAGIRKRYRIGEGTRLAWLEKGDRIEVLPLPSDPIRSLRGAGRGKRLLEELLRSRAEERKG